MRRAFLRAGLVAVAMVTGGCPFIVPGGQERAPSGEAVQAIRQHATTRVDVLMLLGNPDYRIDDDRFFVYDWSETHAIIGLVISPYQNFLLGFEIGDKHALAIEFASDGSVARIDEFSGEGGQALWEGMRAWMSQSGATAR